MKKATARMADGDCLEHTLTFPFWQRLLFLLGIRKIHVKMTFNAATKNKVQNYNIVYDLT